MDGTPEKPASSAPPRLAHNDLQSAAITLEYPPQFAICSAANRTENENCLSLTLLLASVVLARPEKNRPQSTAQTASLSRAATTKVAPVKEKFGEKTVTDPYRWLEDSKSPETRAWIDSRWRTRKNISRR